jgi:hypothetical protein
MGWFWAGYLRVGYTWWNKAEREGTNFQTISQLLEGSCCCPGQATELSPLNVVNMVPHVDRYRCACRR